MYKHLLKDLIVTEVSNTILTAKFVYMRLLAVTESSIATVTRSIGLPIIVTEISGVSISLKSALARILNVTESSIVGISKLLPRTLSITEVSNTTLGTLSLFARLLSITEGSIVSLSRSLTLFRTLSVTATNIINLLVYQVGGWLENIDLYSWITLIFMRTSHIGATVVDIPEGHPSSPEVVDEESKISLVVDLDSVIE
jgi:hypothetical protein